MEGFCFCAAAGMENRREEESFISFVLPITPIQHTLITEMPLLSFVITILPLVLKCNVYRRDHHQDSFDFLLTSLFSLQSLVVVHDGGDLRERVKNSAVEKAKAEKWSGARGEEVAMVT